MKELVKKPAISIEATGLRIKQLMEERNLTVKDIQEYLGFGTAQSIYHWFKGRNLPTIDNLYALSELFKVPIDEMICGNRKINFAIGRQKGDQRLLAYFYMLGSQSSGELYEYIRI